VRQYTSQQVTDPTTLQIFPGVDGEYTLYDDDGVSQEYLAEKGSWIRMAWNDRARQLTIEPGAPAGATNVVAERRFKVALMPDGTSKDVVYVGERLQIGF
jgi:alpha-glucosidase (family GH31 glycosyl hydrolase)